MNKFQFEMNKFFVKKNKKKKDQTWNEWNNDVIVIP